MIQLIQQSDVPAGVVNVLTSCNPDMIAVLLAEHEDIDGVWYLGPSLDTGKAVEEASISNMKRTWVPLEKRSDWYSNEGVSQQFLREATQIKNIWIPYGV